MNPIVKELSEKIKNLEVTVGSKDAEMALLESDLQECLKPALLASKITCTVSEMISELLEFEKSKGVSEKSTASKRRLIGLIYDTEALNTLTMQLNTLQLANRRIFTQYKIAMAENKTLKAELKKIADAEAFLNQA